MAPMTDRTLTEPDVASIRARAEAATHGPWHLERHDQEDGSIAYEAWSHEPYYRIIRTTDEDNEKGVYNAKDVTTFIAACRTDIPALCDHVDALTADRDALLADRDSWRRVAERLEREKLDALARAETAERERDEARVEVERLQQIASKDPNTFMIAHESGDHERLSRAVSDLTDKLEAAEARLAALDSAGRPVGEIADTCVVNCGECDCPDKTRANFVRALSAERLAAGGREAELRKALEPFAKLAEAIESTLGWQKDVPIATLGYHKLMLGDLRNALAALSQPAREPPAKGTFRCTWCDPNADQCQIPKCVVERERYYADQPAREEDQSRG